MTDPIAIVGAGCRLPGGASDPDAYWRLIEEGADAVGEVPRDRWDADALWDPDPTAPGRIHTRWGAFLDDVGGFDAEFFGISPREARRVDPQQRLLLEVAWEALEDAGIPADGLAGSATGVWVGISGHDYGDMLLAGGRRPLIDAHTPAGGALCMAANRLSHHLDLRGPSLAVDTACSSSLTALHLACRSLADGECDLAIVGGVNLVLQPEVTMGFCRAGMLSPRGRCRPFDAGADGYVRGEGAGAVVLCRLADARADGPVRAVIRATAVNQDGRTPGLSVPDARAQEALLRGALRRAAVTPGCVGYVEAHGTGTPVGDPVEARAIGRAIGSARRPGEPLPIGSAKGAIGHLEAAAGIAGLIRAVLALERRRIPATLHHEAPSPAIDWSGLRIRVPAAPEDWPDAAAPPVAVVSAFGFGGANAAAVLEAAPPPPPVPDPDDGRPRVLPLSARSPEALRDLAGRWADRLAASGAPALRDACHTAALGRAHLPHRLAVVAATPAEAAEALRDAGGGEATSAPPRLAFVFTGMGPQWWGMGRELAREEPVAAAALAECDRLLRPLAGWSLLEELDAPEARSRVAAPAVAHAANLALQVAVTRVWASWGVEPDAVLGHSSGEAGAAWAAGALALEDALLLTFHRGRLQARLAGTGGMLAVDAPPEAALAAVGGLGDRVALAAVNGPASVTLAGDDEALDRVAGRLRRDGVRCVALPVDVPYHGPGMAAIREELAGALAPLRPRAPAVAMVSTVTGEPVAGTLLAPAYWWDNVAGTVRFGDAVRRLAADGVTLFVEVGPHPVLAGAVHATLAAARARGEALPSLRRDAPERARMLRSLAALHVAGRPVDWPAVQGREGRHAPMPGYPWHRARHWLEPSPAGAVDGRPADPVLGRRVRAARPTWERDLDDPAAGPLRDHEVLGVPSLPGTAYVEMALAALRALGHTSPALERVELLRLLPLEGRRLQCAVDEDLGRVELHAAPHGDEDGWTLHARARIGARRAGDEASRPVDLGGVRARCPVEIDPARFYRRLAEHRGLRYGPAFRAVASLRRGHGVALGRLGAPGGAPGGGPAAHAVLLDAALHVAAAAAEGLGSAGPGGTVVPVAIGRVDVEAALEDAPWVVAEVAADGAALTAEIALTDQAGAPLGRLAGVRLRPLERGPLRSRPLRYAERWAAVAQAPGPGRPADVARLARAGAAASARAASAARLDDHYAEAEPALDTAARAHARRALSELGWTPGAEAEALGVPPERRALLERVADMAGRAGEGAGPVAVPGGEHRAMAWLVEETGRRLPATLRGRDDPREWLFQEPGLTMLAETYARTPPFRVAAETLAAMVAAARPGAPAALRVVEAGAGTGATTREVLARAGAAVRELLVTDVSPFLVRGARASLADRPGLRFGELDLESPAPEAERGFDVAIAANVVHACRDLREALRTMRRLLAPGGLLLLQEGLRRGDYMDLVFGQLEGWWRFADHDLRPGHAFADRDAWRRALADAGFEEARIVAPATPDGEPVQAVIAARARAPRRRRRGSAPARRWLLLADAGGLAAEVARRLRATGEPCTLVHPGTAARRTGPEAAELRPERASDWASMLRDLDHGAGPLAVVNLWGLDAPVGEALTGVAVLAAGDRLGAGTAAMVRGLRAAGIAPAAIWLVTAGALAADPGDPPPAVAQAMLWGIGRVLRHERGGVPCRLVDLPSAPSAEAVATLVRELRADRAPEDELVIRGGRTRGRRLVAVEDDAPPPAGVPAPLPAAGDDVRLACTTPGRLEGLALEAHDVPPPGPGEVAIRVEAVALNFRDVMVASGVLSATGAGGSRLGVECVGVVAERGPGVVSPAPGERVIAVGFGTLASRVVTRAVLTVRVPGGLTVEEAATIPGAFGSALEALRHLARVRAGDRVLIHSAAGGVGLAAVQIAHAAGAEVVATASTEEKAAYLHAMGVREVLDSRDPAVADAVRRATGGQGVDVVLNSLAGEAIREGLDLLRPGGRFVEMGLRDIDRDAPVGLAPFIRGIALISMRLVETVRSRPDHVGALLAEAVDGLRDGSLDPLPHTVFEIGDAVHAFRLMAAGRHVGRIVLAMDDAPRAPARRRPGVARRDGTHLVVGGLGGLGLDLAARLARRGAGTLVLAGRRGVPRPEEAPALAALRATGTRIVTARCDAAREADLARLLDRVRAALPPLRGVIHAAMVLDDAPLERLDRARIRAVVAPKAAAAWNLHRLTRRDDLDLFLLLGSVSAVVGPPGQAAYAGANAFLTALAAHRRALGLPALAVDLGVVAGTGHVAARPEVEELLERVGVLAMPPGVAWDAVEDALARGDDRLTLADIDWASWREGPAATLAEAALAPLAAAPVGAPATADPRSAIAAAPATERPGLVGAHVAGIVGRVLQAPPDRLDRERSLTDLGLDSLMAVEVTTAVERELGVAVSLADVLEGLSIAGITDRVLTRDLTGARA